MSQTQISFISASSPDDTQPGRVAGDREARGQLVEVGREFQLLAQLRDVFRGQGGTNAFHV